MKVSRSDMFSKYPRASFSSIRSSSCMCHQLVSSHDPDASRTRVRAPDLTHTHARLLFRAGGRAGDLGVVARFVKSGLHGSTAGGWSPPSLCLVPVRGQD